MSDQSHALALPTSFSPDTLDVLTELYSVLQKVHETARESLQSQEQDPSAATAPGVPKPPTTATATGAGGSSGSGKRLTFKDVPGATDGIKHKLQRAREQVRGLPDMERSVAEQEAEVRELTARIEKQRELLERLREEGVSFGKDDGGAERMET